MSTKSPLNRLRHHVTGSIERGESEAVVCQPVTWTLKCCEGRYIPTTGTGEIHPPGEYEYGFPTPVDARRYMREHYSWKEANA